MSTSYSTYLFAVHLAILCGVHGQHTYWIASNTSQCGGRAPCQTLDSYIRYNASLLSASHTKWIFLQGNHYVQVDRYVNIRNAINVTLTGEYPCSSSANEHCSTVLLPKVENKTIHISNVTDLVMINLRFLSHSVGYQGANSQGTLSLEQAHNVTIHAVVLRGHLLELAHPSGSVYISELTTNHLKITIANLRETSMKFNLYNRFWVNVTIFNSTFQFQAIKGWGLTNGIVISETGRHSREFESAQCLNSSYNVMVHFNHCVFKEGTSPLTVSFHTKTQCSKITISNCVFFHNNSSGDGITLWLHGPHQIEVENTEFFGNYLNHVINVEAVWAGKRNTSKEIDFSPSIIFNNCRFLNNSIGKTLIGIGHSRIATRNLLPVDFYGHNVFPDKKESLRATFDSHYLQLGFYGHNVFTDNKASLTDTFDSVLAMESVHLGVAGMVQIENNKVDYVAVTLSTNSKILLHNNSQLRIANNSKLKFDHDTYSAAIQLSIYITDSDWMIRYYEGSAEACRVESDTCDGRHVFQFVDDKGRYIAENDLEYFNASIILSNRGPWEKTMNDRIPHLLIYNVNLQDCTLTLREGNKRMKKSLKRRIFKLDSWDETTIASPAYYACTCDPAHPYDRNLWDCSRGNITTTAYPGSTVRVAFVALGDGGLVQKVDFTMEFSKSPKVYSTLDSIGCTSFEGNLPGGGENYTVNITGHSEVLYNTPKSFFAVSHLILQQRMVFNKIVTVQTSANCPTGFQILSSNNRMTCSCSDLLSNHHFQCTIIAKGTIILISYKSSTNNYWMGYLDQQLVISDHCPSHYCNTVNSTLSTTGLTTDDLNTTIQCDPNSNRQGLLCSQCTPGTSSQFGSFRCTQCTFGGLLLIPFGAVAGIVLILLLFLFNFTVLQGDIIGIAFYANVVGIMDEFLLKYSIRPFYVPLALINLGLGFETCFFDGMDEFSKAIVQFIFPFYLMALLIIIIIAAHKYNLKIFRIRFVARRSVPVLATIMLLTYSGLINAVIYGLQYTHLYNVGSGIYRVLWLHQPELKYFEGKHIVVGLLCTFVTLFYLLPLTIVTLFGDFFRMCSRNLWYSHFLDVFHGAFRYPFGFWFGSRLLLRIVFITLNITTNTSVAAYTIFLTTGAIILLQLVMEPFRTDNVIIYRPDPEKKITRKDLLKERLSKIFRPKVVDSLYLYNIQFITTAFFVSNNVYFSTTYTTVGVCLSIALALAQLIAVTVHHAYHYFPLPNSTPQRIEALRERFIDFRARMRERRRARQNQIEPHDTTPVQIHYLSASMCFNSEEYTSSSSSEQENNLHLNEDDRTKGEGTEDKIREETTEM